MIGWRTLLFVPGDRTDRIAKAAACAPDAVVIDLEDAVAAEAKAGAQADLISSVATVRRAGAAAVVRINSGWREAVSDIEAAIEAGCDAIMVPKAEHGWQIRAIAAILAEIEGQSQAPTPLIALIESPAAVRQIDEIAALPAVAALALGSEDFSLALGVPPSAESLDLPCRRIALAAASNGIAAYGLPISIGEYRDLERYGDAARTARAIGMTGAMCIHPSQLSSVRAAFQPDPEAVAQAGRVVAAWDSATRGGRAAIAVAGRMVDLPVVLQARRLLAGEAQNKGE